MILVFIAGFFVLLNNCLRTKSKSVTSTPNSSGCPNLLVRKGNKLSLLNSDVEYNPGKNPLFFNNLEEYEKYVEGNDAYKMYSNSFEIENGLQSIQLKNHSTDTNIDTGINTSKEIILNKDLYRPFNFFGLYNDEFIDTDNPMNSN